MTEHTNTHISKLYNTPISTMTLPRLTINDQKVGEGPIPGNTCPFLKIVGIILLAKMGMIKNRNGMDLTEAEDIKKRWKEYTKELYKKDIHDQDNHDGVITHLEPNILECEVKWALESTTVNKASGGEGIPVKLFQILKDDAVEVLHSILPANLENSAVATGLENVSFHSNP